MRPMSLAEDRGPITTTTRARGHEDSDHNDLRWLPD